MMSSSNRDDAGKLNQSDRNHNKIERFTNREVPQLAIWDYAVLNS
jgi:hypothetical protein